MMKARCTLEGDLILHAETPTMAAKRTTCGGTGLSPCAPTCNDGCVVRGTDSTCCDDADLVESGVNATIVWRDVKGQLVRIGLDYQ